MVSPFAVLLLLLPSFCPPPPSAAGGVKQLRQKPPQQELGDDVTTVPEGISLWIQELWLGCSVGMGISVLRGVEAFLPPPLLPHSWSSLPSERLGDPICAQNTHLFNPTFPRLTGPPCTES